MTPEECRKRAEYVAKMAEQGILAEPSYDRDAWRAQQHESVRKTQKASNPGTGAGAANKAATRSKRRTA